MALEIAAIAGFHYKRLSLGSISRTSIRCALMEIHSMNLDCFGSQVCHSGYSVWPVLQRERVSESFLDDYRIQFPRPALDSEHRQTL